MFDLLWWIFNWISVQLHKRMYVCMYNKRYAPAHTHPLCIQVWWTSTRVKFWLFLFVFIPHPYVIYKVLIKSRIHLKLLVNEAYSWICFDVCVCVRCILFGFRVCSFCCSSAFDVIAICCKLNLFIIYRWVVPFFIGLVYWQCIFEMYSSAYVQLAYCSIYRRCTLLSIHSYTLPPHPTCINSTQFQSL